MEETQADRIEKKLDKLIKVWDEFEPFLRKVTRLMDMTPAQRVREAMKKNAR